MLLELAEHSCV